MRMNETKKIGMEFANVAYSRARSLFIASVLVFTTGTGMLHGQTVPNSSFERTKDGKPVNWTLEKGFSMVKGGYTGKYCLCVVGDGKIASMGTCKYPFKPDSLYRLTFFARCDGEKNEENGCITSGVSGVNHDFNVGTTWQKRSFIFRTGKNIKEIRLGQWCRKGKVFFDDVSVVSVKVSHYNKNGLILAVGEQITKNGLYASSTKLKGAASNYVHNLVDCNAKFNTCRWVLSKDKKLVFEYNTADYPQISAKIIVVAAGRYQKESLGKVEASVDRKNWISVGKLDKKAEFNFDLPMKLFPARKIYVRVSSEKGTLIVWRIKYGAKLSGNPPVAEGFSKFEELR